jgi:hypothetical protein
MSQFGEAFGRAARPRRMVGDMGFPCFFDLLSVLVRRHEPTAIAGVAPLAAAHSANQEGASFVLAQHFLRDAMS